MNIQKYDKKRITNCFSIIVDKKDSFCADNSVFPADIFLLPYNGM